MNLSIYMRVLYDGPDELYESIRKGDIGYIIEDYGDGNYEVEFSNRDGPTRAQEVISGKMLQEAPPK